jgi:hypothetical protein
MPSEAVAIHEPPFESSMGLAFAAVRDDLVRAYQPSSQEEMLLVNQIARAWFRLQQYYDFELALMEKQRLSEMFESDLARFNSFQRALAAAERMWRNAVREFHAARRRGAPPLSPMLAVSRRPAADAPEPAVSSAPPVPKTAAPDSPPASTAKPAGTSTARPPALRAIGPVPLTEPPATRRLQDRDKMA